MFNILMLRIHFYNRINIMQTFFNSDLDINRGLLQSAQWNYAKKGLVRNIEKAIGYYQSRTFTVKSDHLLVRLLKSLGVSYEQNLERFTAIVEAKSLAFSRLFGLSSSLGYGKLHSNVFYGPGETEIIVAIDDYFNPYYTHSNWKSVRAVKVISHSKSDLDLVLPNGKNYEDSEGISVISVNIAELAVQYRAFVLEQYLKVQNGENASPTSYFVHTYVIPNMLYSHLDYALFNRFNNLLIGSPNTAYKSNHPFFTLDYSNYVDKFYSILLRYLRRSERSYDAILNIVPNVDKDSLKETLRLPDWTPTRQIAWVEIISRIDACLFLSMLSPKGGNKLSGSNVNYFLREFKHISQDNILNSLPMNLRLDLELKIDDYERNVGNENNS